MNKKNQETRTKKLLQETGSDEETNAEAVVQPTITEAAGSLEARQAIREVITDFVIGILGAVGIFLIEMAFR